MLSVGGNISAQCQIDVRPNPTKRRISRFSEPLLTSNPGECCQRCLEMPECIGFIWHACCNHCWIHHDERDEDPSQTDYCESDDCVVGTVRRETNRTVEDLLNEVDMYIHNQTFVEYLPAYLRRCDKEYAWHAAAISLQACTRVKERCGLEQNGTSPDVLDTRNIDALQDAPSCQFKPNTNFWYYDISGFNPHPARQTAEECCRRCQLIRGCKSWTRLPNGECYLKYRYDDDMERNFTGHISGIKIKVPNASTSPRRGIRFEYSSGAGPETIQVSTSEQCRQACLDHGSCLVWSFGESTGTCYRLWNLDRWRFRSDPNYETGYIVPVNETSTCNEILKNSTVSNLPQLAYNLTESLDPTCHSILTNDYTCENNFSQGQAEVVFRRRVERSLEALGMNDI
eukprot:g4010.t1